MSPWFILKSGCGFPDFSGQKYLFFQTFQGIFQLYMKKHIIKLLLSNNHKSAVHSTHVRTDHMCVSL